MDSVFVQREIDVKENPLYFYFVEANNKIPADSGIHWNMSDSSGFQWNRIDANAL
jgi:hypothetical protein